MDHPSQAQYYHQQQPEPSEVPPVYAAPAAHGVSDGFATRPGYSGGQPSTAYNYSRNNYNTTAQPYEEGYSHHAQSQQQAYAQQYPGPQANVPLSTEYANGDYVEDLHPHHGPSTSYPSPDAQPLTSEDSLKPSGGKRRLSQKHKRRLYWIVPLAILGLVLVILFEVYKDDFERWVQPLADWLSERDAWSWVIPVAILVVLSFPPLFGHELVQIVVGLTYPIGVAIGIAVAGAVLGEAACFVVFKYCFTSYADKRIRQKVRWAAIARVSQQAGFWGVLTIRYSIVPPHLANPIFACTGMTFWLYMVSVILSLPKVIVFVVLGTPSTKNAKGAKIGKIVAVGVLVIVTLFATRWIRTKLKTATREIEAERAAAIMDNVHGDQQEELGLQSGRAK